MLVIGAGGFARQLLEVIGQLQLTEEVAFFDNVSENSPAIFSRYPILRTDDEIKERFSKDNRFVIAIGTPKHRRYFHHKLVEMGGRPTTIISPHAFVSKECTIGDGSIVMTSAIIENGVEIGNSVLINIGAFITHENHIGDFTEISPGVRISGNCVVGSNSTLGTGAIVIPKIKIGSNVVVAAGAVVTKDIPDNVMAAGVPATIRKEKQQ